MKMAPGVFWGIIFIVVGFVVIIKVVFNINIPLFRILVAAIFILIGIKILIGPRNQVNFKSSTQDSDDIIFSEQDYTNIYDLKKEYNVVFGKGTYDFSSIDTISETKKVSLNIVFGSAVLRINPDLPIMVKSDAVFSGIKFPDGSTAVFGTNHYRSPSFVEGKPYLHIKADAVFSGLEIVY